MAGRFFTDWASQVREAPPGAGMLVNWGMDSTAPHPIQVSPQLLLASPDLCLGIALSLGIELTLNKRPLMALGWAYFWANPLQNAILTVYLSIKKKKSASS